MRRAFVERVEDNVGLLIVVSLHVGVLEIEDNGLVTPFPDRIQKRTDEDSFSLSRRPADDRVISLSHKRIRNMADFDIGNVVSVALVPFEFVVLFYRCNKLRRRRHGLSANFPGLKFFVADMLVVEPQSARRQSCHTKRKPKPAKHLVRCDFGLK